MQASSTLNTDHAVVKRFETAQHVCTKARQLWLEASDEVTMSSVEQLYRSVWIGCSDINGENLHSDSSPTAKKSKLDVESTYDVDHWRQHAGEKLALILLQSARFAEANKILVSLGYTFRLADSILCYPTVADVRDTGTLEEEAPCRIFDNFVEEHELSMLDAVFLNPNNCYWTDHNYSVEPPSPYFSYLIPLQKTSETNLNSGIISLVSRLKNFLKSLYPVENASYCEMWAHNRPHATGHQFHFDSDNEGCTKTIRNPICSCVLYLTGNIGGPSVITNQRLASQNLATAGWMSYPEVGRLLVFDGKFLHGVIPGKAHYSIADDLKADCRYRRVSVMFAFWTKIRVRDNSLICGAAKAFPEKALWAQPMHQPISHAKEAIFLRKPVVVLPLKINHVYVSTKNNKPWARGMGFPNYDNVFQGF